MASSPIVALVYRNFRAYGRNNASHVGLGVNAFHTAKVLRAHGIEAFPIAVWQVANIVAALHKRAYTHAVIDALWVKRVELAALVETFPDIQFLVRSHSQVGFLQVEPGAVQVLRDSLDLQEAELNLRVAGNSERFTTFVQDVYNQNCTLLPNLYFLEREHIQPFRPVTDTVRIASFGSLRHLKMHSTAASGALILAQQHGVDLEFHLSVHREEHGSGTLQAIRNLFRGLPWATLVEDPWQDWGDFRRLVAHMSLFVQVSATETFNIATADAVAEGVPCVVSPAINWAPRAWHVDTDDPQAIARVGWALLHDPLATTQGLNALRTDQARAFQDWKKALDAVL